MGDIDRKLFIGKKLYKFITINEDYIKREPKEVYDLENGNIRYYHMIPGQDLSFFIYWPFMLVLPSNMAEDSIHFPKNGMESDPTNLLQNQNQNNNNIRNNRPKTEAVRDEMNDDDQGITYTINNSYGNPETNNRGGILGNYNFPKAENTRFARLGLAFSKENPYESENKTLSEKDIELIKEYMNIIRGTQNSQQQPNQTTQKESLHQSKNLEKILPPDLVKKLITEFKKVNTIYLNILTKY
jgi:hypothetical protein